MKKKIAVGVALIAFLLAGSGLWYTRPQTFWDATGMDWDKITGASGYAIEGSVTDGTASQQIWMLDNLTPGHHLPRQPAKPSAAVLVPLRRSRHRYGSLCIGG